MAKASAWQPEDYELDLARYELRCGGKSFRLERQPMELLILLAGRPGHLVTREDIVARLWSDGTFVDADRGINNAIHKLRLAFHDDPEGPRFVETVVGKGYRLIAPIKISGQGDTPSPAVAAPAKRWPTRAGVPVAVAGLAVLLGVLALRGRTGVGAKPSPAMGPIRSVAVLQLRNLSGSAAQDYFAEGLTDELTTTLARSTSLRVISSTSTLPYRDGRKPLPQIARELGVDAVIEGSVVRSGAKVRITAQLVDARSDAHLWAQTYERDLGEILEIQDAVARDIAGQVKASLSPDAPGPLAKRRPLQPDAYEAYLRGRNELGRMNADAFKSALQHFQHAIDLDPLYAQAYAGLADSHSLMANYQVIPPRDAFPLAEAAARKALDLDPLLAEAHASLGLTRHHFDWDWAAAEGEYKRAIQLDPSLAVAHLRYAEYLSNAGLHDDALREIRRAQELDPLSKVIGINVGRLLYYARRYDEAIEQCRKLLAVDQSRLYTWLFLGVSYEAKRDHARGFEAFDHVTTLLGGQGSGVAHLYASAGRAKDAKRILRDLERPPAAGEPAEWYFIAAVYAQLGDKDRAFGWLEKGVQNKDYFMTFVKVDPWMDPLRSDPRFAKLVQRVGVPDAHGT